MLSLSTSCSFKLLNPQNPFQNCPKTRKGFTKISKRKFYFNDTLRRPSFDPFSTSLPASPVQFQDSCKEKQPKTEIKENIVKRLGFVSNDDNTVPKCISKLFVFAVFYVALALVCPIGRFHLPPAVAATSVAATEAVRKKGQGEEQEVDEKELDEQELNAHDYSHFTRRLLDTVSRLVAKIEEVRNGKLNVNSVEEAFKEVKMTKKELQDELMKGFPDELITLNTEKEALKARSEGLLDDLLKAKKEEENLRRAAKRARGEGLQEKIVKLENEYNHLRERIGQIDDQIFRREMMALGVKELSFIERECEQLVKCFLREMRQQNVESSYKGPLTKLSRSEIKEELQSAQRKLFEQIILPNVLESEEPVLMLERNSSSFAQRIKQVLRDSREMQKNLESRIRKNMKKYGEEKRFLLNTPVNEVVKGFPEVELKWMFGDEEVVVPKAVRLHLFHGWKKWREEEKANLKRELLKNVELGKKYVAERQERILLARDRLASNTWYNEERNRWEMDPISVPYAVSQKLVQSALIRHDWGAMYIKLKGDDREYYIDVKEFDMLFEDFGGFDGLYLRMLASGIPTGVRHMWIPFSELSIPQQLILVPSICYKFFSGLLNSDAIIDARNRIIKEMRDINDDVMIVIICPIIELIIPYQIKVYLGMTFPEYADQSVSSPWYLNWRSETSTRCRSRQEFEKFWYLKFLVRSIVYGYVLFHIIRFMRRKIRGLLQFGRSRRDPNLRKLQTVKYYFKHKFRKMKRRKRKGVDPISRAFDRMKRVKNPPIQLKDFSSIESMKEEIHEVVAFLQNPRAFQEMGARAPRGVLIVGEKGSGKTSLALAIAAEAKVPVVKVNSQQLEAGLWVGEGASNIRELFQTARDLAPVIIFVEDFDLFAGVRGKFHTRKQEHEAFINQLLVELDGFEKQDGVVLMATTKNLKQIDEALQRPGRMDRIFHLQKPTQTERERILRAAAKETMDEDFIDFVDWRKVAEKTALLRPIELKHVPVALEGSAFRSKFLDTDELMSYCSWFATFSGFIPNWLRRTKLVKKVSKVLVNHLGLTLSKEDLQNVVDLMEPYGQISNGIELLNPPVDWTRETKFPHAVWAAGRGLIASLLPNFDIVENLWLEPFSWEGIGCTKISKTSEGSLNGNVETRGYLEKQLVFCFGSYIASQLLLPFGEENLLSSSELKKAEQIATRMVIQYGWGPDDSLTIYYHGNVETPLSMGNNCEYEIAAKVEKIYYLAYDKAKTMLQRNRKVLEKIVDELLEYEILTGKDLERIIADYGGTREKEPFYLSNTSEHEPVLGSFLENGNASGTALMTGSN